MRELTIISAAALASWRSHLPDASSQTTRILWALAILTVVGCGARLLVDEQLGDAPVFAALLLVSSLLVLQAAFGSATGLLAFLMMPSLFGAAPWNSPVRAYFGSADLPIYVFDALLVIGSVLAVADAVRARTSAVTRFLHDNWLTVTVVGAGILVKIAGSGVTGETLRNAALFYYFPAVFLTLTLILPRIDLKRVIPAVYLRSLPMVAIAPVVVLIGIAVDARDVVLTFAHQGVEPAGILGRLPPGSLALLSFCAAAFLFNGRAPWPWRLVIVVLLAYDAVTYGNRAMWFGISAGIGVHWAMVRSWRAVVLLCAALVVVGFATPVLLDSVRASHNESGEWRLLVWTLAGAAIVDSPLGGHPYGQSVLDQVLGVPESRQAIADAAIRVDSQARSPHNSYLSLLFFGGVVQGGAIILFISRTLGSLGRAIVRLRREGLYHPDADGVFRGAVAVTVYAAFNVVLESPVEGITFWTILFTAWLWRGSLRDHSALEPTPAQAKPARR